MKSIRVHSPLVIASVNAQANANADASNKTPCKALKAMAQKGCGNNGKQTTWQGI